MSDRPPACPRGTGPSGRRIWTSIVAQYELEPHELALLTELTRAIDRLDGLDALIRRDGLIVDGGRSGAKANPALVEARQLQITVARLEAALRMPQGDTGDQQQGARPQRRGAPKGVYGIRGSAS